MGVKPKHAGKRVRNTMRRWAAIPLVALLVGLVGVTAPSSATPPPSVKDFDYGVTCTEAWLYPGRALVNGDHINIDVVINGVKQQRNAYVDQNVSGGYDGLGIRINGFDPIPLTETQVKTGTFHFVFSDYISETSYTVEWVQFNSVYFNQDRDPEKFLECDGTPPPEECVPEYEWVKKATLWKYEHLKKVMKDQVKAKKEEQKRSWNPKVDGVKEREYTRSEYTYTRWQVQKQTHKGKLVNNGTGAGAAYWLTTDMLVDGVSIEGGFRPLGNHDAPRKIGDRFNYNGNRYIAHPQGEYMYVLLNTETSKGFSPTKSGWTTTAGPVVETAWFVTAPGSPWTATGNERWKDGVEPQPGSWGPWGSSSWVTPHQVTEWLDAPVTNIDMPGGPWVLGEWKFLNGDESKRYRYVQYDTRTVLSHTEVLGTDWFKKGEQPEGWTLVQPEKSKEVVVDGPLWSTTKPGDDWVKTGKERKVNCIVASPDYTPGTCQAPGTLNLVDTDIYHWVVTGPISARVATAVPNREGDVLTGQTVFGPYDLRQVDWKSEDCQPYFEVEQRCAYVKITYHNDSGMDRWPDYSFTGDTKEPTDFGSGPTWNTVKVAPGESKVIFERQFEEDYADGGPIEVWYQDILGAERDIDTPLVTLTVVTDCEANEVVPVLPEVTPQVCTPPNGDLTGGAIVLPEGPEGLEYAVYRDEVEVTDLTDLEPGDYPMTATVVGDHLVIAPTPGWTVSADGQSATTTVTIEAAEDCSVEKPPTPPADEGEWTDVSKPVCGDTTVTQTRWVRTFADPVWDDVNQVWVEDKVGTVTEETRVRDLTPEELADLEEECTELPPPPEEPEDPKDKVRAPDVKFTDPTLVCKKGEWTEGDSGKVTIPKGDGLVYLIKNEAGKYVEIEPGTIGTSLKKVSVIVKSTDKNDKLVGKTEWSHTFKPVKQGGGDCELATTGGEFAQAVGLVALLLLTGAGAVAVSRLRNRAEA